MTLKDIRFWILLFFFIRLIGITYPPLEVGHNWRQSFTCMVARNFLEIDPNILYPRIDMSGSNPDIVASEFPAFNYLIYLAASVFEYDHWYGRLINLIFSSLGIYYFFLLARRYFGARTAFYSALILISSIWFIFSWKIMPDTFSVSMVIMALYCGIRYLIRGKIYYLLLFLVLSGLGGLSKIPSTVLLSIVIIPLMSRDYTLRRKTLLFIFSLLSVLLISSWYFYWQPYLLRTYQNQLYYPFAFADGIKAMMHHWQGVLEKFYFESFYSYIAFLIFLSGMFFMFKRKKKLLISIFFITLIVFLFFAIKTGDIFPTHNYYIIPFVPVMALIAGYALNKIRWPQIAYIILGLIFAESIANQHVDFRLNEKEMYKLELEKIADQVSHKDDLIAITGGRNPQQIYFAHRKGWILDTKDFLSAKLIDQLRQQNCKYLFINRNELDILLHYPVVYKDNNYIIYKL